MSFKDNIIKDNRINVIMKVVKKIKITDFPCKCKQYYCKNHKFPNLHNCNYDYKEIVKKNKHRRIKMFFNKIRKNIIIIYYEIYY